MTYHEYEDGNGHLRRSRRNGHRRVTGWDLMLLRPGDEYHFETRARAALVRIEAAQGNLAYRAWFEREFERDGKTVDDFTWREIAQAAQDALEHPSECDCIDGSCRVCVSMAHVLSLQPVEA